MARTLLPKLQRRFLNSHSTEESLVIKHDSLLTSVFMHGLQKSSLEFYSEVSMAYMANLTARIFGLHGGILPVVYSI
jgi:hypothetical protein